MLKLAFSWIIFGVILVPPFLPQYDLWSDTPKFGFPPHEVIRMVTKPPRPPRPPNHYRCRPAIKGVPLKHPKPKTTQNTVFCFKYLALTISDRHVQVYGGLHRLVLHQDKWEWERENQGNSWCVCKNIWGLIYHALYIVCYYTYYGQSADSMMRVEGWHDEGRRVASLQFSKGSNNG